VPYDERAALSARSGFGPFRARSVGTYRKSSRQRSNPKSRGAVAIKFEVAYLRSLDFEPASADRAAHAYSKYVGGAMPRFPIEGCRLESVDVGDVRVIE
jgi:hypothetical protein